MNSDKDKLYIKIVPLDGIYNFVVETFFNLLANMLVRCNETQYVLESNFILCMHVFWVVWARIMSPGHTWHT
jgi:hypothetical protein